MVELFSEDCSFTVFQKTTGSRSRSLFTMVATILLVFSYPYLVSASGKYYYYIHTRSFRVMKPAMDVALHLQNRGYKTVVRRERVADLGDWYLVYVGPFASSRQAHLMIKELRQKKLITSSSLHKKQNLIISNVGKTPEIRKKKVGGVPIVAETKVLSSQVAKGSVSKTPPKITPRQGKVLEAKPVAAAAAGADRVTKPPSEPTKPERAPSEVKERTMKEPRRGNGRNVGARKFALGWQHTYRKIQTELTNRKRTESDGTSTTTQEVPISSQQKDDFPTSMHMDLLQATFGITDWLEVFAGLGVNYKELDNVGFAYGGGLRLNLFEVRQGWSRGFYGGFQAEYLEGELEDNFTSVAGQKWKKEADWQQIFAKAELGIVRSRVSIYAGGSYLNYREDTKRTQLENLPAPLTSVVFQDDLEEEESFGAYGGISVYLSRALLVNVEGQVLNQESISGKLEYRF